MASNKDKKQKPGKPSPAKPAAAKAGNKPASKIDFYVIALGIVVLLVALVRARLLAIPFERDEGEYAYIGNLILNGGMPYRDAYNMKLPGAYVMYSIIMTIFGSSPTGVHTGLMLVSMATIILLYISFRRLFNPMVGLVTATVFGLLVMSRPYLGFAAHATNFVTLFMALGLFSYTKYVEKRNLLWALVTGLMFGLSFLMKQQAVFFILFAGVAMLLAELFNKPINWKKTIVNTAVFSVGVFVPYILVLLWVVSTGAYDKFWFWTVDYANQYSNSSKDWKEVSFLFNYSFDRMFSEYPIIWLLAGAGLIITWLTSYPVRQKLFITVFALMSVAVVCPGFFFREHYFIVMLPALGLLAAISMEYLIGLVNKGRDMFILKILPFLLVMLMFFVAIGKNKTYYVSGTPEAITKMAYGSNPFIEAQEIGKYIKENSKPTDKIAILGSEPEFLVYADRMAATGYIYVYPLLELHKYNKRMQQEMIAEIEKSKAEYLVYVGVSTSWLARPGSPTDVIDWLNKYVTSDYNLVGMVEIPPTGAPSNYYWGADANRKPQFDNYVHIFRRKPAQ